MAAFGRQIKQFSKDLGNRTDMGGDPPNRLRAIMQVVISLLILGAGVYALLVAQPPPSADTQKIMVGLIGTVVGYWLR